MKRRIMVALTALMVLMLSAVTVSAAELSGGMSLLETVQDVVVYDAPDGTEVGTLPAQTAVLTLSEEENGWIKVMYQEITGYVKMSEMTTFGDIEALDNEYANTGNTHKLAFEEMRVQEEQHTQEMIWGAVLIVIIIAIFGCSIYSAVKQNKEAEQYKPIYKGQKRSK